MSILVFMSDNRTLQTVREKADYNSLVASINYEYCKKYNYDFVYYRPYLNNKEIININNCIDKNTHTPRHAAWSKLLSTNLALELNYDYVIYIDSDCIFKDFNKSLDHVIKLCSDKDIVFTNNKPWCDNLPCSGFYMCKVNENTKHFLQHWYNKNWLGEHNKDHPWEQHILWKILNEYNNIALYDTMMFYEEEGQFLRHVGNCDLDGGGANRIPYFTNFININNINYEKNIGEIKCVDFNTNAENIFFINYPITNKSYSWATHDTITFLDCNEMNAFGWGYYHKIDDYTFNAFFGGWNHILIFNSDYTEFMATRCGDNATAKGRLL
jgi:hypothetical protein